LIAGKYQVEKVLGAGGMGVVVAALHLDLERRVAIKLMLPEVASHADSAARFLREGKAAVRLKSEHVARVLDVGRLDTGVPYMVMELLEGADLSDLLQARGPLPVHEAVDYILQASEAVAEAPAVGIVHRDLKPANLFVSRDAHGAPCVKVLDFGISKVRSADGTSDRSGAVTSTQTVMGSPLYMSPEQMRSARQVDARADVWGLGAILYELLTGQTLWSCESLAEVCAAVLTSPSPRVRALAPHVPEGLEAAILMCLEKDVNQRMPSVKALVQAIAPFASPLGRVSADRVLGAPSVPPPAIMGTMPSTGAAPGASTGPGYGASTGPGYGASTGPGYGASTGPGYGASTGPGMNMPPGSHTNAAWGNTGPGIPAQRSHVGLIVGMVAVSIAVAAVAVFFTVRALAPGPATASSAQEAASQTAAVESPSASAASTASAVPGESSAEPAASAAPVHSAGEETSKVPAGGKVGAPVGTGKKPPVKATKTAPAPTRTDYGGRE